MEPNVARLEGTKQAILERLAPADQHVLAVANGLKIRESAIRRHFDQLERMGLVRGYFRQEGLGRPKKYYALTEWGLERFPKLYAEPLERTLNRIVQEGRAPTPEDAVQVLAKDRMESSLNRLQAAQTPLALARAIERAIGESGVTVRGRIRGDTLLFDLTSCLVLRTALHMDDPVPGWQQNILSSVVGQVPTRTDFKIEPGEILCPPAAALPTLPAHGGEVLAGTPPRFPEGTSVEGTGSG